MVVGIELECDGLVAFDGGVGEVVDHESACGDEDGAVDVSDGRADKSRDEYDNREGYGYPIAFRIGGRSKFADFFIHILVYERDSRDRPAVG